MFVLQLDVCCQVLIVGERRARKHGSEVPAWFTLFDPFFSGCRPSGYEGDVASLGMWYLLFR